MRRPGDTTFRLDLAGGLYKFLLILLSRQLGATGRDIGECADCRRLGQKHLS